MNWLNLEVRTLRSPAYMGSDPIERATWLNILAYCCEQENGGRIVAAAQWKDRQWQQLCGVTRREIKRTSRLLTWDGDTLVVEFYPVEKEAEVRMRREIGRDGGLRSSEKRAKAKENPSNASSTASTDASSGASTNGPSCASSQGSGNEASCASTEREGEGEGKDKEKEKEKEKEQENGAPSPAGGRAWPKTLAEVEACAATFPVSGPVPRRPDAGFVEWWFDEQEKRGWTDPETGLPWRDWSAAFRARWRGHVHRQRERGMRHGGPPAASSRAQAPQHAAGDDRL